ncbi:MAG TPA: hypothetical protein DCE41_33370, partial [Cytophagales bacterium]|nr:hypothetical protein [Cytophagales bacterium]
YNAHVALDYGTTYYWSVTASNSLWSQTIDGTTQAFETQLPPPSIDNFETYPSNAGLNSVWTRNPGGGDFTMTLETAIPLEGSQSLAIDYSFSSYAGASRSLLQDWSGYDGISFEIIGDNSGRELLFQFQEASGEYWEQTMILAGTQQVFMPFASFTNPSWGGSVNGVVDPGAITQMAIYLGGSGGSGSILIDDIRAAIQSGGGNVAPVAQAGPDVTVADADNSGTEAVGLVGSGSYDSDG